MPLQIKPCEHLSHRGSADELVAVRPHDGALKDGLHAITQNPPKATKITAAK